MSKYLKIYTLFETDKFFDKISKLEIKFWVATMLRSVVDFLEIRKKISCNIFFVDEVIIKKLNKNFRKIDKSTNVLSFPINTNDYIKGIIENKKVEKKFDSLGDIFVSYENLFREANESNVKFFHHFLHLVLHSFLHLLGYDHENEDSSNMMEKIEIEILEIFRIENPYI